MDFHNFGKDSSTCDDVQKLNKNLKINNVNYNNYTFKFVERERETINIVRPQWTLDV